MAEKDFEEIERKIDVSETQGGGSGGGEAVEGGVEQGGEDKNAPKKESSSEEKKDGDDDDKEKNESEQEKSGESEKKSDNEGEGKGSGGEGDEKDLVGHLCVIIGHGIGEITSKKGEIYIVKSLVDKLNRPVERFSLAVKGDNVIIKNIASGELREATILHAAPSDNSVFIEYLVNGKKVGKSISPLQVIKLVENEKPSDGKDGEEKDPLIGGICGVFRDGAYKGKVCEILGKNEFGDYILRTKNDSGIITTLGRMWFAVVGDCVEIDDGEHERITKISPTAEVFETDARSGYSFSFIVALSDKCEPSENPKEQEDKLSLIGQTCVVLFGDFKGESGQIIRMTDNGFDIDLDSGNGSGTWARIHFAVVGDCVYFNRLGGGTSTERIKEINVKDKTWLPEGFDIWHDLTSIIRLSEGCPPKEEPKPEEESTAKIFSSNSVKFCRFVTEQVFKGFNVLDKFGNKPFLNDVIYSFLISTFSYRYATLNWTEAVDMYNEIWMYDEHKFETKNPNEKSEYDRISEIDNLLFEELVSIVPKISNALDDQYQADFIYNAMQVFTGGMPFAFIHNAGEELFTVSRIDEEARFIVSSKEHPTKLNYLYSNGNLLNWVFVEREFLKMDEVASLIRKMCKSRSKYIIGTTLGNAKMLDRIKDVVEQFAKTI